MTAFLAELPHRALLSVLGEDAKSFLQGLVTQQMENVTPSHSMYGAFLSPQGKFLHDFFILAHGEGYLLECDRAMREAFAAGLRKYKLRAKIVIEESPFDIAALWSDSSCPGFSSIPNPGDTARDDAAILFRDPRLAELGARAVLLAEDSLPRLAAPGFQSAAADDYERHRLELGVPEGHRDLIPEKSFILDYGFDELHAVDFTKGCYVGQEVTARMKHRGNLRKQLYQVDADGMLPPAGTALTANGVAVGELRSTQGSQGIALLRRDTLEEQGDPAMIQAGERSVSIRLPVWKRQ